MKPNYFSTFSALSTSLLSLFLIKSLYILFFEFLVFNFCWLLFYYYLFYPNSQHHHHSSLYPSTTGHRLHPSFPSVRLIASCIQRLPAIFTMPSVQLVERCPTLYFREPFSSIGHFSHCRFNFATR